MSATAGVAIAALGPGGNYSSAGLLILRIVVGGLVAAHGLQKTTYLLGGAGLAGGAEEFREDGFRGALFLAAHSIGMLIAARVVGGLAAGFGTGTATASLAELQPRGDSRAAAVLASGSNLTGLGLGPLAAGIFGAYVAMPTRTVFSPARPAHPATAGAPRHKRPGK